MSAIVIHISSFFESPRRAVRGVVANRNRVKELHFVYPLFQDEESSMYPEWLIEDRPKLEKAQVKIFFNARLAVEHFGSDVQIITEVPPECEMTLGAFDTVKETMKKATTTQTHFGLTTKTVLNGFSILYGFLIVSTLIDWFWNRIFERNKLIQHTDIQSRFILQKGKHRYIPEGDRFTWRLWNPSVIPKQLAGDTAVIVPRQGDYTARYLNQHAHYGFGLWLLPLLSFWIVLSITWTVALYAGIKTMAFIPNSYAFGMWAAEFILCSLICGHYMESRANLFYYVMFPVYFALFPFAVVYYKNG